MTRFTLALIPALVAGTAVAQSVRQKPEVQASVEQGSVESEKGIPEEVFHLQPGFQVEKVFTVPKDELGSWVSIAFDNRGRLLASDEHDRGICRITLPGMTAHGVTTGPAETVVERLDFSKCAIQPTAAQGMLYAFDSLYLSINGGPGTGLYRARDTDGDDQFDECVKLREFNGTGEHGPHALRLSPDGKRIFLIAGNHTDPPFEAGEDLENEDYSSRIPTNWGEDLLLPRMWDANGHARGRMAPGGWIASTDPDGKTWDLWSVGYRNAYDMAFNADGELFAWDADMEWDYGTPWYRPTRVVHATSGSEFGWRSGTGKWPAYYFDSLPPLIDIGPGSPVGVEFGYGTKFPAKYQRALYICDWTFGTMYAIHMTPEKSSYAATKEEFVSRTPLPLTDVAAGPDGALYFTTGGRRTDSELFRVTYVGKESTEPTTLKDSQFVAQREARRAAEQFHGDSERLKRALLALTQVNGQIDGLPLDNLESENDRALSLAYSRVIQLKAVAPRIISTLGNGRPSTTLQAVAALARGAERTGLEVEAVRTASLTELQKIEFDNLALTDRLNYVRALSLVFIRLGAPSAHEQEAFLSILDPHFPAVEDTLSRELCQMLVYLGSPTVIPKTISMMKQESSAKEDDLKELLARNPGYAGAINAMLANPPDRQQVWYAYCLRVAEVGWTMDLKADYFRWFARSQNWAGGLSFRRFLQNIDNELWEKTPENERILLEAAGARVPFHMPELPKPEGPGQEWTLEEVRALAEDGLTGRDFKRGQTMFAASKCIVCHRFAGDGGATGPDLTQLAGRFNIRDLTEAIMDPNKVVSDQYRSHTIVTTSGKTVSGRIVAENDREISVLTDPEDSTKIEDIPRVEIDETVPSTTSLMPANLLNALNKDEVLDLLAYLLSRGDDDHEMFTK